MDINLKDIWIHNEDITRKIEQWRYNWDIMGRPKFIAIWMGNYSINHCPDKSWSFLLSNLSNNKLFTWAIHLGIKTMAPWRKKTTWTMAQIWDTLNLHQTSDPKRTQLCSIGSQPRIFLCRSHSQSQHRALCWGYLWISERINFLGKPTTCHALWGYLGMAPQWESNPIPSNMKFPI